MKSDLEIFIELKHGTANNSDKYFDAIPKEVLFRVYEEEFRGISSATSIDTIKMVLKTHCDLFPNQANKVFKKCLKEYYETQRH